MDAPTTEPSATVPNVDVATFRDLGYTVIKRLFGSEEIKALHTAAVAAMDARQQQGLADVSSGGAVRVTGDLLSLDELRPVLLNQRLIAVIHELLGGVPGYFGDSNVRIGAGGRLGWKCHRDDPDTSYLDGPNSGDPYPLVRCGIYLEDHARHSSGLGVIPRSQRGAGAPRAGRRIVDSEVGDLVAWDLRILHSGQMTRFRPFPNIAFHPRLAAQLARLGLEVPEECQRIALFLTFGLPSDALTQYIDYLKTRDYAREGWGRSGVSREIWETAADAGLRIVSIPSFYVPSNEERPREASIPSPQR